MNSWTASGWVFALAVTACVFLVGWGVYRASSGSGSRTTGPTPGPTPTPTTPTSTPVGPTTTPSWWHQNRKYALVGMAAVGVIALVGFVISVMSSPSSSPTATPPSIRTPGWSLGDVPGLTSDMFTPNPTAGSWHGWFYYNPLVWEIPALLLLALTLWVLWSRTVGFIAKVASGSAIVVVLAFSWRMYVPDDSLAGAAQHLFPQKVFWLTLLLVGLAGALLAYRQSSLGAFIGGAAILVVAVMGTFLHIVQPMWEEGSAAVSRELSISLSHPSSGRGIPQPIETNYARQGGEWFHMEGVGRELEVRFQSANGACIYHKIGPNPVGAGPNGRICPGELYNTSFLGDHHFRLEQGITAFTAKYK